MTDTESTSFDGEDLNGVRSSDKAGEAISHGLDCLGSILVRQNPENLDTAGKITCQSEAVAFQMIIAEVDRSATILENNVFEMASAEGIIVELDPAIAESLVSKIHGNRFSSFETGSPSDETESTHSKPETFPGRR